MVAVARPDGPEQTGWSAIRPVMVAFLLVADAFAVVSLAIVRPDDWSAPFLGFGVVLLGLVWFLGWSIRHRGDDD
jgi:hypothetical protein